MTLYRVHSFLFFKRVDRDLAENSLVLHTQHFQIHKSHCKSIIIIRHMFGKRCITDFTAAAMKKKIHVFINLTDKKKKNSQRVERFFTGN